MSELKILDAAGSIFFAKELEAIKARAYNVLYPDISYDKAFPISTETPNGADTIVSQTFDRRGSAKIVVGPAGDIPRADVEGREDRIPVRPVVSSFGYTIDEIEAARFAGKPLQQMRANACRRTIEEKLSNIAWFGDSVSNLKGFLTSGLISSSAAPSTGSGGASTFASKTAAQILIDVNYCFATVFEDSLGVERANRLGMPLAQWNDIMTRKVSDYSDMTIAQFIVANSPWISSINDIMALIELDSTINGTADMLAVWTKDPMKLSFEMVMDVTFMEPQLKGLEYVTIGRAKTGGMNVHYPKSAYILTGI